VYRWRANSGQCRGDGHPFIRPTCRPPQPFPDIRDGRTVDTHDGIRSSVPPTGSRRRFPTFAPDEPSTRTTASVHPAHLQAPAAVSRHSRRTNRRHARRHPFIRPTCRLRRRFSPFAPDEPSTHRTASVHPSHLQNPAAVSRHSRRTNRRHARRHPFIRPIYRLPPPFPGIRAGQTRAPLRPTLRLRRRDPAMGCASLDSRAAAAPWP
jgi:hypothetical protein